jgi:hypothetical protein
MDGLIARLKSLLRGYPAARDESESGAGGLVKKIRRDLESLVAKYGPNAVDAVLDEVSGEAARTDQAPPIYVPCPQASTDTDDDYPVCMLPIPMIEQRKTRPISRPNGAPPN